jgi:hypothetical protein
MLFECYWDFMTVKAMAKQLTSAVSKACRSFGLISLRVQIKPQCKQLFTFCWFLHLLFPKGWASCPRYSWEHPGADYAVTNQVRIAALWSSRCPWPSAQQELALLPAHEPRGRPCPGRIAKIIPLSGLSGILSAGSGGSTAFSLCFREGFENKFSKFSMHRYCLPLRLSCHSIWIDPMD